MRRGLLQAALLAFVCLQALWPLRVIENLTNQLVAPIAAWLTPSAGFIAEAVALVTDSHPEWEPLEDPDGLIDWERRLGNPPPVARLAWLEVPVLEVQRRAGRLRIAAGRDFGLALGQAVVYGQQWLGRIQEVEDHTSWVELWNAANARTGVSLEGETASIAGVASGMGPSGWPWIRWMDPKAEPQDGMNVLWRRREQDPRNLDDLELRLGSLRQEGDRERDAAAWVITHEMPPGAEGRVYIAAGAVGSSLVAEPTIRRGPASVSLFRDATLGAKVASVRATRGGPAAVVLQEGRVIGPVVVRRGNHLWFLRRSPGDWREEALALDPEAERLLQLEKGEAFELEGAQLYTRGAGMIPRGLPIGSIRDPQRPLEQGELEIVARQGVGGGSS